MEREIIQTLDGSTTIHIKEWNESYHSKHGAIQEAQHVFIKNGLSLFQNKNVSILEIGFGTGLNAFITYIESKRLSQKINYSGVEAYPISSEDLPSMNYIDELRANHYSGVFEQMHESEWEIAKELDADFVLTKRKQFFQDIDDVEKYDLKKHLARIYNAHRIIRQ